MPATPMDKQVAVLLRISRGESMTSIADELEISYATVQKIRRRNPQALDEIKRKIVAHQISTARKLLDKSQDLLDRKLDRAMEADHKRAQLSEQLAAGKIDAKEYKARLAAIYEPTIAELNAVARESFNRAKAEEQLPGDLPGKAANLQHQLVTLVDAIKAGDEVVLQQMVFSPQEPREIIEGEQADAGPAETENLP